MEKTFRMSENGVHTLIFVGDLEKLSKVLKPLSKTQEAGAAVALLLKPTSRCVKALFVERAESPADPWSGQMALPGGKREGKDQSLKDTIVRETLEETNINLLNRCRFLGVLSTVESAIRPELKILPFVILLEHEPSIKLNAELKSFMWISPEALIQNKGIVKFAFGEFPAYIVGNSVIWGVTYRILEDFTHNLGLKMPRTSLGMEKRK
jgi:8-oxo-dGTP diphosphatase